MEYITARAQPMPKAKPRKKPMMVDAVKLMMVGVYRVWGLEP